MTVWRIYRGKEGERELIGEDTDVVEAARKMEAAKEQDKETTEWLIQLEEAEA